MGYTIDGNHYGDNSPPTAAEMMWQALGRPTVNDPRREFAATAERAITQVTGKTLPRHAGRADDYLRSRGVEFEANNDQYRAVVRLTTKWRQDLLHPPQPGALRRFSLETTWAAEHAVTQLGLVPKNKSLVPGIPESARPPLTAQARIAAAAEAKAQAANAKTRVSVPEHLMREATNNWSGPTDDVRNKFWHTYEMALGNASPELRQRLNADAGPVTIASVVDDATKALSDHRVNTAPAALDASRPRAVAQAMRGVLERVGNPSPAAHNAHLKQFEDVATRNARRYEQSRQPIAARPPRPRRGPKARAPAGGVGHGVDGGRYDEFGERIDTLRNAAGETLDEARRRIEREAKSAATDGAQKPQPTTPRDAEAAKAGQTSRGAEYASKPRVANRPRAEDPGRMPTAPAEEPSGNRAAQRSKPAVAATAPRAHGSGEKGFAYNDSPHHKVPPPREPAPQQLSGAMNFANKAGAAAGVFTGARRIKQGVEDGSLVEGLVGGVEVVGSVASAAKPLAKKAPLIGAAITAVDGAYEVAKTYDGNKGAGENAANMMDRTGAVTVNTGLNLGTFGLAGGAGEVLYERRKEQNREMLQLGTKAAQMALGKRELNAAELANDSLDIAKKDLKSTWEAAKATTIADDVRVVGGTYDTVATHFQEAGRFDTTGRTVEETLRLTHDTERAVQTADQYPKMAGLGGRFRAQLGDETGVIHWENREVREKAAKMFGDELKRAEQLASDNAWYKLGDADKRRGGKADADIARSALDEINNLDAELMARAGEAAAERARKDADRERPVASASNVTGGTEVRTGSRVAPKPVAAAESNKPDRTVMPE